jgi:hypothetical protein
MNRVFKLKEAQHEQEFSLTSFSISFSVAAPATAPPPIASAPIKASINKEYIIRIKL